MLANKAIMGLATNDSGSYLSARPISFVAENTAYRSRLLRMLCFALTLTAAPIMYAGEKSQAGNQPAARQPNILLIVVDDMGFADLGSFGGEIDTPNLDRLAMAGIRLTNFQVAPTCSTTRSMLLTGVDSHKAGLGNMLEELADNQKGKPGYEGYLNNRVVTLPTLLRDAGYRTYMTGKWHLGLSEEHSPAARGFDRSFALAPGGASHFADMRPAYAATPDVKANYRQDGKQLEKLPANFEYSSQFYVDQLIDYIDQDLERDSNNNKPFFAYLSFTAPHWPLQAPNSAIEKYAGRYASGYDALLRQRLQKLKALGLLAATATSSERAPGAVAWNTLSGEQQKVAARAMAVYAAMIDQIDVHTGRLLDYLKKTGQFDNTAIVFMSDNGPEGHDLDQTWPAEQFPKIRQVIDETHDFSYGNMGKPGSYVLYGPNWARAGSPALRWFKGFPTEGGTRVASFVHFPQRYAGHVVNNHLASVKDITPTVLQWAGVEHPGRQYKLQSIEPMTGISLHSTLLNSGKKSLPKQRIMAHELMGKRMVRAGPWKMVHMPRPYGNGAWQLYNVAQDLAENKDLARQYPARVESLKKLWQEYASENQVILPDWVSGY